MTGPVTVAVPATSANLGPGFDSLGLALGLFDDVTAEVVDSDDVVVEVEGEGAAVLPHDGSHLVASTIMAGLAASGVPAAGLRVRCVNRIPHGRGLGSSAAAIVVGVALARALAGDVPGALDDRAALQLASDLEGHPDNVAAALLGGFTIAWRDDADSEAVRAVSVAPHPDLHAVVCIPTGTMPTKAARGLLPPSVPHADAAITAARAALLSHAMTADPSLLLPATADLLHQPYRASAMPATMALVTALREAGLAAMVSGAGPSVLVLSTHDVVEQVAAAAPGFDVRAVSIEPVGARVISRG